ncbi:MAG: TrmH family RNA methyltransferase [Oscillospiraceae bacterium]
MINISSRSNDNIKLFRKLSEQRRERTEKKLFTLEGVRLIADAAAEKADFHSIFASQSCLEKYSGALSPFLDDFGGRLFVITEEIADYLAETRDSQGIFAICGIPAEKPLSDIISRGRKYIMLSDVRDPGNMGTIIRTADAVGTDAVICCGCCDIYNPKVIRSAMGSLMRMTVAVTDEDSAFAAFKASDITTYAAVVDCSAKKLTDCDFSGGAAILIGNEGNGLSTETADRCNVKMTIPMKGRANSLNAAMAAGIILWELSK